MTPKDWLTHQRLNRAKSLLEERDYSIERIAEESGFDNATTMRHHFRKEFWYSLLIALDSNSELHIQAKMATLDLNLN